MILCFSHLLSFLICTSLFLFALKMVIMPGYCYYYFQFMAMKKKYLKRIHALSNAMDSSKCGLGLITNETARVANPNVVESSSPAMPSRKNKDPGGIGFIDEMGGGVDGLMSCTESLGFESCDERRVDDDDHGDDHDNNDRMMMMIRKRSERKKAERNKKFPPPLSSLNQNGQPCFYLKPVRKNGRLELTEVRIQRPEIFRAVRENGRLRLHLVGSGEEKENEESKQEEEPERDLHSPAEEEELWKYRINGEDYRRCHAHEMVMSHHHHYHMNKHHSLHVWRQPCVTR